MISTTEEVMEHPWGQHINKFVHNGIEYAQWLWFQFNDDNINYGKIFAVTSNVQTGKMLKDQLQVASLPAAYRVANFMWSKQISELNNV